MSSPQFSLDQKSIGLIDFKTQDRDVAQDFFSENYSSVNITSQKKNYFDLKTRAVVVNTIGFSQTISASGYENDFHNPYDGYGVLVVSNGELLMTGDKIAPVASKANNGLIIDASEVRKALFSERSAWHYISIGSEELHRHIMLLTEQSVVSRVKFAGRIEKQAEVIRLMHLISQSILQGTCGEAPLLSAPAALASLKDAICTTLVESLPNNYSEFLRKGCAMPAPRSVKRAIDYMHANLTRPIRLEDIAEAVDVSPRSLQIAFRQFRDTTPMAYLKSLRLRGVHHQLLNGPPTARISEVAYQWGFAHHGLFSANYLKAFGEQPSATLRRGK